MARVFQSRPEPTTWESDKEFSETWGNLVPDLPRVTSGRSLETVLPDECHAFLATVTSETVDGYFDNLKTLRAEARANRSRMRDAEFVGAVKCLMSQCLWINGASERVRTLKGCVGDRYRECSLDTFRLSDDKDSRNKQTQIVAQMSDLIDNMPAAIERGASLFIFGPVGSGKDHLLTAAMIRAVRCGYTVKWFNGMDLYGSFRDSMDEDKSESSQLRPLIAADVLALSDPIPPVGEVTPYQRSMLFRVIDRRYRDRKPTWVTANVATRAEADARFGAQLVDRITDGALRLQCNWPSHRADRKWTNEQGG